MKNFVQKLFKVKHFSVYPNPATKGKVVNLTVKNAGNYSVQLIDNTATLLHEEKVVITDKHEVKLFNIPSLVNSGMYSIRLVNNENNKQFASTILVR